MLEEIKTIQWTCDKCGKKEVMQVLQRDWLTRPEGWTNGTFGIFTMGNYDKDFCKECSILERKTCNDY